MWQLRERSILRYRGCVFLASSIVGPPSSWKISKRSRLSNEFPHPKSKIFETCLCNPPVLSPYLPIPIMMKSPVLLPLLQLRMHQPARGSGSTHSSHSPSPFVTVSPLETQERARASHMMIFLDDLKCCLLADVDHVHRCLDHEEGNSFHARQTSEQPHGKTRREV